MHMWGDGFDFDKLHEAECFIRDYVYKKSRCLLISKEKYGTIRYEYIFPPGGGIYTQYYIKLPFIKRKTKWGHNIHYYLFKWNEENWIYRKWAIYGRKKLKKAIDLACEKWPELEEEIRWDYDEF